MNALCAGVHGGPLRFCGAARRALRVSACHDLDLMEFRAMRGALSWDRACALR